MQAKFPGFVAGFDLVGQEDVGRRLLEYAEAIMTLPKEMKLFFHAGETNWNGMTDDNLVSTHRVTLLLSYVVTNYYPLLL